MGQRTGGTGQSIRGIGYGIGDMGQIVEDRGHRNKGYGTGDRG